MKATFEFKREKLTIINVYFPPGPSNRRRNAAAQGVVVKWLRECERNGSKVIVGGGFNEASSKWDDRRREDGARRNEPYSPLYRDSWKGGVIKVKNEVFGSDHLMLIEEAMLENVGIGEVYRDTKGLGRLRINETSMEQWKSIEIYGRQRGGEGVEEEISYYYGEIDDIGEEKGAWLIGAGSGYDKALWPKGEGDPEGASQGNHRRRKRPESVEDGTDEEWKEIKNHPDL
ncbi:hypothetical protein BJ684DRAFT_14740 [Piptocephalis cylindrospora]|uniref:Endonuclease/exonuclease/phosphatase domain-containing protein n=1 Tax=Piptocephalis cylindrospora TaxID=1907219 RepID=A0A4P9Y978_9FUNG|nr:hypothetical protein BJ684DRAFT_14740 [Piptocephalis cylindrospora]|eukprot:RKP14961.1 hypothetical protein BJ684DRAFT_14740 [Piptocephalis cylindrospora]